METTRTHLGVVGGRVSAVLAARTHRQLYLEMCLEADLCVPTSEIVMTDYYVESENLSVVGIVLFLFKKKKKANTGR